MFYTQLEIMPADPGKAAAVNVVQLYKLQKQPWISNEKDEIPICAPVLEKENTHKT